MKKLFLLPILFLSLISTPCLSKTSVSDLVERDGIYYKKFTETLFSGEITGKVQGNYKRGKKEGEWVSYDDNGQLSGKGSFKNGKRDGAWVKYHDNGQLKNKGSYKNGKREGDWVGYHDNGNVSYRGSYKNGKKEGEWVSD